MVRHRDIKRDPVHVLGGLRPTNSLVMAGAAIAGPHNQRLAKLISQGLQLIHGVGVDLDRAGATAGDFGWRKARPAPGAFGHVTEMGIGRRGHGGLQK